MYNDIGSTIEFLFRPVTGGGGGFGSDKSTVEGTVGQAFGGSESTEGNPTTL
jgi:hypothetical protein